MEYYAALERKEILSRATTRMNLMLSEISQSQKDKYYMILLTHISILNATELCTLKWL